MTLNAASSISHKRVWQLSWPIIASNVSIPLLGATHTAVMGHLPDSSYIGAIAIATTIISTLYLGFNFLRMGTTGLTAQAYGENDSVDNSAEIIANFIRPLLISFILGFILIIFQKPLSTLCFFFIDAAELTENLASIYFDIRIWSALPALANFVILGWLLGIQRPMLALALQVFMNLLNILLSVYFVMKLSMTVEGIAYASIISEYSGFLLGLISVYLLYNFSSASFKKCHEKMQFNDCINMVFNKKKLLEVLNVNSNIFIRTILLLIALAWFTVEGSRQGELALAANAVLLNFLHFLSYALDGFAQAAEVLVGQSIGKNNLTEIQKAIKYTSIWAIIFALIFSLSYFLFGKNIINLLTNLEELRNYSYEFLIWIIIMPITNIWSYQLDGIFIGATKTIEMRNSMLIAFLVYAIALLSLTKIWANHGLWLAFILFMLARAITLYLYLPEISRAKD